jgi:hypothetical protein
MEEIHGTLFNLMIAWGAITAVLVCLIIYRGTLESREGDQIFLDTAQETIAAEQRAIVARIEKVSKPIKLLIVLSGALLIAIAGVWLYQGFKNF